MSESGAAGFSPGDESRASRLLDEFLRISGRPASFVVRAPGRVNLLGEHTDYNGLPVLPMAIDRNVLIAGVPRPGRTVRLFNTVPQFPARNYEMSDAIVPYAPGDWGNYAKAATQGLMRQGTLLSGADLLVDGNIPAGAGLSSSSALVVASALALLAANEVEMPFHTLAELLPVAERYVGTLSGGMDQATSLLARAGHALRIDFFPLRLQAVPLPAGYRIVVCHSLVPAEKSGAAQREYNLRVIECRLACRVLERALGNTLPRNLQTLGDLAAWFPGRPLVDFLPYLTSLVPERPLRLAEIAAVIGTSSSRLAKQCEITPLIGDAFALVRRVRHVLSEADRVNQAVKALVHEDAAVLGHLMDSSHWSCRDDYEISCPALEAVINLAREAGALGARLTGAGFGGCSVNLVPEPEVPVFLTRLDRSFYAARLPHGERVSDYRFVFTPQPGATVVRF